MYNYGVLRCYSITPKVVLYRTDGSHFARRRKEWIGFNYSFPDGALS